MNTSGYINRRSQHVTLLVGVSRGGRLHLRNFKVPVNASAYQIGLALQAENNRDQRKVAELIETIFCQRVVQTIPRKAVSCGPRRSMTRH